MSDNTQYEVRSGRHGRPLATDDDFDRAVGYAVRQTIVARHGWWVVATYADGTEAVALYTGRTPDGRIVVDPPCSRHPSITDNLVHMVK